MCLRVVRGIVVLLALAGLTCVPRGTAYADTVCQVTDPLTGQCTVWVEKPGQPGSPGSPGDDKPKDSGSGAACYWDPTKQGVPGPPAGPVPCTSESGYWTNTYNCYLSPLDPQPPANDPAWQGHRPDEGTVYECYQPQTAMVVYVWADSPPPGSGTGPTPREVAELAVDQMRVTAINIGIAPEPGPDSVGLVGMPVWMWAQSRDEHNIGPITANATAGGMTITATARLQHITWDMGDGTQVVCETAGTPYQPSYARQDSPDCGHIYKTSSAHLPGETYTVTATSSWVVTWSGAGQTGTILLDGLNRSTQIRIGEAQVLVN